MENPGQPMTYEELVERIHEIAENNKARYRKLIATNHRYRNIIDEYRKRIATLKETISVMEETIKCQHNSLMELRKNHGQCADNY